MTLSQTDSDDKDLKSKIDPLFTKPEGVLLKEEQWMHLKELYHMTPRELQVAILVCRGFSNSEIADALKVRQGTVKTHLRNIYRRTRVRTKIQLLLRFLEDVKKMYAERKMPRPPIFEGTEESAGKQEAPAEKKE